MEKKVVPIEESGRLDVVLSRALGLSRSQVSKEIRAGRVLVGEKAVTSGSFALKGGEEVTLLPGEEKSQKPAVCKAPGEETLDFVYRDEDIAVINKRLVIVVNPAPGHYDDTLVNYLAREGDFDFDIDSGKDVRPGIVHRIDKDTSGLLVVALHPESQSVLQEEIRCHEFERLYLALVQGRVPDARFCVNAPLTRPNHSQRRAVVDPIHGREAITHCVLLSATDKVSLLRCRLDTGRTHQIRSHLSYINHPLVGDPLYGRNPSPVADRGQALHAYSLSFLHPRTMKRMTFFAPLDDYFLDLLRFYYR